MSSPWACDYLAQDRRHGVAQETSGYRSILSAERCSVMQRLEKVSQILVVIDSRACNIYIGVGCRGHGPYVMLTSLASPDCSCGSMRLGPTLSLIRQVRYIIDS